MPRYHFTSFDGRRDLDPEGVELADHDAARIYAARYVGELLQSEPDTLWQAGHWAVEVTDADGALLFSVATHGIDAPRGSASH